MATEQDHITRFLADTRGFRKGVRQVTGMARDLRSRLGRMFSEQLTSALNRAGESGVARMERAFASMAESAVQISQLEHVMDKLGEGAEFIADVFEGVAHQIDTAVDRATDFSEIQRTTALNDMRRESGILGRFTRAFPDIPAAPGEREESFGRSLVEGIIKGMSGVGLPTTGALMPRDELLPAIIGGNARLVGHPARGAGDRMLEQQREAKREVLKAIEKVEEILSRALTL